MSDQRAIPLGYLEWKQEAADNHLAYKISMVRRACAAMALIVAAGTVGAITIITYLT